MRKHLSQLFARFLAHPLPTCITYLSTALRNKVPALKTGALRAGIFISAPVWGLRPLRALRLATLNVPNPTRRTPSFFFMFLLTTSTKDETKPSTTFLLCPVTSAISSTSSLRFMLTPLLNSYSMFTSYHINYAAPQHDFCKKRLYGARKQQKDPTRALRWNEKAAKRPDTSYCVHEWTVVAKVAESALNYFFSMELDSCITSSLIPEGVLRQKYLADRLSMRQIASEFPCSKTYVRSLLLKYNIPMRKTSDYRGSRWYAYGKRRVGGKTVDHKGELRTINTIKQMYHEGNSTSAIARCLNAMKLPTKQQGKGWHQNTVATILKREGVYVSKDRGRERSAVSA